MIPVAWLQGAFSANVWPMSVSIRRVSGLSANGSTNVVSGSHCWWSRGASMASWRFIP